MISVGKSGREATSKQGRRITSGGSGSGRNALKARNIITGWARGRSTSCLGSSEPLGQFIFFGRSSWSFEDLGRKAREDELNWKYHQGQQAIQDAYFERYRTKMPVVKFLFREIA